MNTQIFGKKNLSVVLVLLALLAAAFLLAGCRQQIDVTQPPQIVYGQDVCDRCQMIISEEKMAAAYWTSDDQAHRFDDIGGMLLHAAESSADVASWWVHDLNSGDWLNAETAVYVLDAAVDTPMGFGIVAFAERAAAEAFAFGQDEAVVLDFAELRVRDIQPMMTHQHD